MKDFKKYIEIFIIIVLFMGFGYFVDTGDPCFLYGKINLSLFLVSLLILFYGESALLLSLVLYALAFNIFYDNPPVYKFLQIFALGILIYIFYFIWHRKVREAKIKEEYLDKKLKENAIAFYTLKASYDKLERDLLTKPFTLSSALKEILTFYEKDEKIAKEEFLKLLRELYYVRKAHIITLKDGEYLTDGEVDIKDPLFQKVLKKMIPLYLNLSKDQNKSRYLCVIPLSLENKKAFLVIEEMPFMFFTKDALLEIAVIFTYFMQNLEKREFYAKKGCKNGTFRQDFSFELCRLKEIYKLYKIPSSLIVFKSKNLDFMKRVFFLIQKEKRGIDMVDTFKDKDGYYVVSLLFPFLEQKDADSFFERIKQKAKEDRELIKYFKSKDFIHNISLIGVSKIKNISR